MSERRMQAVFLTLHAGKFAALNAMAGTRRSARLMQRMASGDEALLPVPNVPNVLQEVRQNKRVKKGRAPACGEAEKRGPPGPSPQEEAVKPGGRQRVVKAGATRAAEEELWALGYRSVAGVDEAGRGPLAGPVVAAAVILPKDFDADGINDSKALNEQQREELYVRITTHPEVAWSVCEVDHQTIDRINILQAALLAMQRAVDCLSSGPRPPDFCLVDGNRLPGGLGAAAGQLPARAIVKGDSSCSCIAAASILAKVHRDRLCHQLHTEFPLYGFAQHKGYGVPAHMEAIARHGPCPAHRRSFEPIKSIVGWTRSKAAGQEGAGREGRAAAAQPPSPRAQSQQQCQQGDLQAAAEQEGGAAAMEAGPSRGRRHGGLDR